MQYYQLHDCPEANSLHLKYKKIHIKRVSKMVDSNCNSEKLYLRAKDMAKNHIHKKQQQ